MAEQLAFGQVSTGAQNDLERATEIARAMVAEYGMSPKLGPLSFGRDGFRNPEGRLLFPGERAEMSEETARVIDQEVSRIISEARDRAKEILDGKKTVLDRLAKLLMVREVLEGKELEAFVEGRAEIPSLDEERTRVEAERVEQKRALDERREAREEERRKAAVGAVPHATEDIPTPPHLRDSTEELQP
ncbi:MAG TPA: hypothetical protein VFZ45_02640, partial [Actinomycetota bacterium]|nr:hypothetical protein [Actinomycetota bacterium]